MQRSIYKIAEETLACAYAHAREECLLGNVTAGELAKLVLAFAENVHRRSFNQARLEAAGFPYGFELLRNKHGAVFVAWRQIGRGSGAAYNIGAAFCSEKDFPGKGRTRAEWVNRGREIAAGRLLGNPRRLEFNEGEPMREAIWNKLFAPYKCINGKYLIAERGKFAELWGVREYESPAEGDFEVWMRGFLTEEMNRRVRIRLKVEQEMSNAARELTRTPASENLK